MRIAILADPLDNQQAGIHSYTRLLVEALDQYDTENEYILIREKEGNQYTNLKQVAVNPSMKFPGMKAFRVWHLLPQMVRKLKVDAVFEPAHFGPFNVPSGVKRVTMIHDLTPILFPHLHRWHSQLLQKLFLKGILKRADLVLTNSDYTKQDVVQYYPFTKGKTESILLGRETFFAPNKDKSKLKSVGVKDKYFLYTGTIEPRKNLVGLLQAFQLFKDRSKSEAQLVITGEKGWRTGSFFQKLKNHEYQDDIVLTGYVDRALLPVLYTNAIAFIYPSQYEGFGLPVVEAMSCGTPCVLSDNSSLPEVGGDAPLYFNWEDVEACAEHMNSIYSNPSLAEEMSKKSLQQASKFSWEAHVKRLSQVFREYLA